MLKDEIIDNITEYPRDWVEKVVAFQGEEIIRAVKNHSQVEISGLGLLYVAKGKLQKRIDRMTNFLEKADGSDPEHEENIRELLEFLKEKKCQNLQNT